VDGEESLKFGGGRKKNKGWEKTVTRFVFCLFSVPGGGEYKLINWDGHYRRYVAAKLHSDDINTRIYGK
jgi:hypothetical protein